MSDVNVSLGVTGKDVVLGAFSEVSNAGKAMGETFGSIAGKLAGLAAGYLTVSTAVNAFSGALNSAGRLNDFSDQTGIAVEKLVLLERSFQNNGMQAEDLGMTINKMQKYLVEAGDSGSEAAFHIEGLGLSMADIQRMSPDQQFEAIGKAIAGISDPSERSAAAMGIFGKSGGKLMAFFNDFNGSLSEASTQVGTYAQIMGMNAKEFDKLGDTIKNGIGHKLEEFALGALSNVTGGLQGLADFVANFDAAKFGKQLTENMGAPLKAFANDIKEGNFKGAFEIAYEFVKLQALKMINELLMVGSAAAAGIKSAFATLFSNDSSFVKQAENVFTYLAHFLEKTLIESLAGVFRAVPGMSGTADNLMQKVTGSAAKPPELKWDDMTQSQNWTAGPPAQEGLGSILSKDAASISQGWSGAWDNIEEAGKNAARAVSAAWKSVGPNGENITEQEKKIKNLVDKQNAARGYATSTRPASTGGSGGGGGGGGGTVVPGGASWKAKMAPIIDAASVNTGLYKNTNNLGLDMQTLLAASSMGISYDMAKMFDSRISTAQNTGNFSGAASLMREKAVQTQAQQENDLRRSQFEAGGYGRAAAQQRVDQEKERYGRLLTDTVNKTSGPLGSGIGAGGSGSSSVPKSPEAIAMNAVSVVVENIYKYMTKSLPQHALT